MHHHQGNAILARPCNLWSDCEEILFRCGIPRFVLWSKISTLWVQKCGFN